MLKEKLLCYVLVLSACLAADVALKIRRERSPETIFLEEEKKKKESKVFVISSR